MAVTLKDIAKATGLSVATVSKYINGATLREKNRAAIERAIRETGYSVNEYARGLKSNRSRTVGVVIPELSNLFITEIITHMEELLRGQGYSTIVCDCRSDERIEAEAVRFLLGKMVDGIINMPAGCTGEHLKPAVERNVPVVLLDRRIPQLNRYADSVCVDNEDAAYTATAMLLSRGHRRIGIIVGPNGVFTSQHRLSGYRKALAERGLEPEESLVAHGDYTVQGGCASIRRLLRDNPGMTAVFVTNYEMTLGAVIAINEISIRVPDELSVVGFDNMDLARITHPRLTIVTQPLAEIGARAARIMLERLGGGPRTTPLSLSLPTTLCEGSSVRDLTAD